MFSTEFEYVEQFLRGQNCYHKVAGFEAAVDVFSIYPNACLIVAFTLKDDRFVVNLR